MVLLYFLLSFPIMPVTFFRIGPPTPPLSQHFALSDKQVLMLALGIGGCAVFPEMRNDPLNLGI